MEYTFHHIRQGMMFVLKDQPGLMRSYVTSPQHPYMIISDDKKIERYKTIYCATITSATNNLNDNMIPVLCSNDYVSYIDTTKIYEYKYENFTMDKYKGMIGNDIYTPDKFMKMIQSLLIRNIYGETWTGVYNDLDEVVNEYKDKFFKIHSEKTILRDTKLQARADYQKTHQSPLSKNEDDKTTKPVEVSIDSITLDDFDSNEFLYVHWKTIPNKKLLQYYKYVTVNDCETTMKSLHKTNKHQIHDLRCRAKKKLAERNIIVKKNK